MPRVTLIPGDPAQAPRRAADLRRLGYAVASSVPASPDLLRAIGRRPPAAIVIDLSRRPSRGRDIGLAIRLRKATRRVPLVFVEGEPEKVAGVRKLLPDASYTTWSRIGKALERAIAHPPEEPVKPRSLLEAYAGRPLAAKMGIKPASLLHVVDAPPGFLESLGPLPPEVVVQRRNAGPCDLTIWFVRSIARLRLGLANRSGADRRGPLWIAWPKKSAGKPATLTQQLVRESAMERGWVDYKICSIDATWSALLFTRRASRRRR